MLGRLLKQTLHGSDPPVSGAVVPLPRGSEIGGEVQARGAAPAPPVECASSDATSLTRTARREERSRCGRAATAMRSSPIDLAVDRSFEVPVTTRAAHRSGTSPCQECRGITPERGELTPLRCSRSLPARQAGDWSASRDEGTLWRGASWVLPSAGVA